MNKDAISMDQKIRYRPLKPSDYPALKYLHGQMFPIDYADTFFTAAINNDGIVSFAAVIPQAEASTEMPTSTTVFIDGEQLAGFITLKIIDADKLSVADRHLLGIQGTLAAETCKLAYILTLGVVEEYRYLGIATKLVEMAEEATAKAGCYSLYLHVISYNEAAIQFYRKIGFQEEGMLENFYHITTGRAALPLQTDYDAYVFNKPLSLPVLQSWSHLDVLTMPVKRLLGSCMGPTIKSHKTHHRGASPWLRSLFGLQPSKDIAASN